MQDTNWPAHRRPEHLRVHGGNTRRTFGHASGTMLTSGLMVIASLVILQSPMIRPASAEITFLNKWGENGDGDGQFNQPSSVAVSASGHVYVADDTDERIQRFDADGAYQTQWGASGDGNGQFKNATNMAVSASGRVYVVDGNNRIQRFDADGAYQTQFGESGNGDGQFDRLIAVAVAANGRPTWRIEISTAFSGFSIPTHGRQARTPLLMQTWDRQVLGSAQVMSSDPRSRSMPARHWSSEQRSGS